MLFRKDTIGLFELLVIFYEDRDLFKYSNIIPSLERFIDEHCDTYYQLPWFRVYAYWQVHIKDPIKTL